MTINNPFEIEGEAKRYHVHRPRYHHIPFGFLPAYLGHDFEFSLDVACGTGHSTEALSKISKRVIGCDLSETMLNEARKNFAFEFIRANAEKLPFTDNTFDFVNISMGFHWLDQERFLAEAKRVLKERGYLAIDSYAFLGKISEDPDKQKSHSEFFAAHLPYASQRPLYPSEELMHRTGLSLLKEFKYEQKLRFNADAFTNLIMTWSNFQVLSEAQKTQTAQKMHALYEKIFEGKSLELKFGGKTLLFQFTD